MNRKNELTPQPRIYLSLTFAVWFVGAFLKLKDEMRGTFRTIVSIKAKVLGDTLKLVNIILNLWSVGLKYREIKLVLAFTEI